jgi:predicted PurR-regulated permease PerM
MNSPVYRSSQPIHPRSDGWTNAAIIRTVALVVFIVLSMIVLWRASDIVMLIFLGMLFGLSVAEGATHLERLRIPRPAGAALIVIAVAAAIGGIFTYSGPTLVAQTTTIRQQLPAAVASVQRFIDEHTSGAAGAAVNEQLSAMTDTAGAKPPTARASSALAQQASDAIKFASSFVFGFLSSSLTVLAGIGLMFVLAIYIGADEASYRRGLLSLLPPAARPRAAEVLEATAMSLRKWLETQAIAMVVIGIANFIALSIIGVQAALALALIAGLLEFIPTLGPIISGALAVAMAFIDSPAKAMWVLFAVVLIQQLEGNLLIPYLMKGALDLPPALTLVTQAMMAVLFGFTGMLVAVPLLAAVVVPVRMLYVEDHLGGPYVPPKPGGG